ncbi:MAG: sulfurtransferase complex subunit TusC [Halomonas sp.]|uniref:sulfurtransferase complex subunit TusC n=1 Tax=Halomonas sp. TaxID=1486246 RepID=UPI00180EB8EC|nr:sulfurtransferase complex subunit TusC [Halomonas sp.]NWN82880.1 sulfurtransferase complex subunit TusC [Halomonas sp.]
MTEDTPSAELLVILRHAPHGSSWLKEGLDVALVAAAFDRRVTLLFMGEGVTALLEGQQAGPLGQKGTAATLEMLEMYDIDSLVVEKRSLDALGLSGDQLMLPTREVTEEGVAALVASHALVLNF